MREKEFVLFCDILERRKRHVELLILIYPRIQQMGGYLSRVCADISINVTYEWVDFHSYKNKIVDIFT